MIIYNRNRKTDPFALMKLDLAELPHFLSGACLEVHRELGPGLAADVYRNCLARELRLREIFFEAEVPLLIHFRGVSVESGDDLLDFIVESSVVILVRSIPGSAVESERGKLKSYLRHTGLPFGMMVNFNVRDLRTGIWRVANSGRFAEDVRDVVLPA